MKFFEIILTLLFVCFFSSLSAFSEKIPFRMIGKLIVIEGVVDGQSGNFILDTGVSNLILNSRYFKGRPRGRTFQAFNGQVNEVAMTYSKVEIGDNEWKTVYAEIIPMRLLEDAKGIPVHGLLGTSLFQKYTILIDFDNLEIELYPLDKKGESDLFNQMSNNAEQIPFKLKGGAPLISLKAGRIDLNMSIDSGAEINLIREKTLEKLAARTNGQLQKSIGGLGEEARQVQVIDLKDILVGTLTCRPVQMGVTDLREWNQHIYGPLADGIIGYEFLSQFRVAFNFKKRELYLWERSGYSEPILVLERNEKDKD